jgi:purine-binding chemotaxis protein CheW
MSTNEREPDEKHIFDWDGARERIAAVGQALEVMEGAAPEMVERIWAQRAAQLAKPPTREEKGGQIELALVQMGCEVYSIEVTYILEIRPAVRITRVPRVPEWVAGVTHLRGRILSVLDLRRFFGLAPAETNKDWMTPFPDLVVVGTPTMEVALVVEDVLAIETFPIGRIQDVTETIQGVRPEYVRGVLEWEGSAPQMVVVLDLSALLADEQLIIEEETI